MPAPIHRRLLMPPSVQPMTHRILHLPQHCAGHCTDTLKLYPISLTGHSLSATPEYSMLWRMHRDDQLWFRQFNPRVHFCWHMSNLSQLSSGISMFKSSAFHCDLDTLTTIWTPWMWIGFHLWDLKILQIYTNKFCYTYWLCYHTITKITNNNLMDHVSYICAKV